MERLKEAVATGVKGDKLDALRIAALKHLGVPSDTAYKAITGKEISESNSYEDICSMVYAKLWFI